MTDPVRHRPSPSATSTATHARTEPSNGNGTGPSATAAAPATPAPPDHASAAQQAVRGAAEVHDRARPDAPAPDSSHASSRRHVRTDEERTGPRTTDGADRPLTDEVAQLAEHGFETRDGSHLNPFDELRWDPASDDLTDARNAHRTNTPDEMREGIDEGFNWFEGDLRIDDHGTLVMAHDADQESKGLTLDEWLAIGDSSERGMKVDVKETAAIPKLLDQLERSGIPDGRIMINVPNVPETQIREIRRRFPDAWLAINPGPGETGYSDEALDQSVRLADAAGGRVTFPIRWDIASDHVIDRLREHGKVSIWTATSEGTPDDRVRETRTLRDRGVEGVIDLGDPLSFKEQVLKGLLDVWESAPVRAARDGVALVRSAASTAWHTGTRAAGAIVHGAGSLASDAVDGARKVASHIPVVGGLFD